MAARRDQELLIDREVVHPTQSSQRVPDRTLAAPLSSAAALRGSRVYDSLPPGTWYCTVLREVRAGTKHVTNAGARRRRRHIGADVAIYEKGSGAAMREKVLVTVVIVAGLLGVGAGSARRPACRYMCCRTART